MTGRIIDGYIILYINRMSFIYYLAFALTGVIGASVFASSYKYNKMIDGLRDSTQKILSHNAEARKQRVEEIEDKIKKCRNRR